MDSLRSAARIRRKRLELFGGNLLSELLFALVLGAACRAYGADLSLAELVFVNTAAGILSGLIPVPGGIGAAEASVAAGLIAVGVDESTAFAIALNEAPVHLLSAAAVGLSGAAVVAPQGVCLAAITPIHQSVLRLRRGRRPRARGCRDQGISRARRGRREAARSSCTHN